ncbi:RDD family protein [Shewanella dokdonensis]|uniref:RDD family protein n=1 Tax=Shewanella dokdonensis TaxID=712036 RepID=A0ABX8DDQ6_9GAMM|nr:RDD family protein [Shewanella dokdonensis]MCL1073751.1 RDD family protein [Shewanella dokdonensis]QVK22535.1 RDD family protein [Shewanella dokdonensis]
MTEKHTPNYQLANLPRASLGRRLGAALYDLLLALAIYSFAGIIGFALFALCHKVGLFVIPEGTLLADNLRQNVLYHGLYQCWLLLAVVAFYSYFWSHAGQTLGMQAWRLRVQHLNGQNLSLITAIARLCWSLFGIGNLWLLVSKQQLALQDRVTHSEVVVLPTHRHKS